MVKTVWLINFVVISLIIWGRWGGGGGVCLASGNVYGRVQSACNSPGLSNSSLAIKVAKVLIRFSHAGCPDDFMTPWLIKSF